MGIHRFKKGQALCGLLLICGLTATGCKSGPSFSMPSMPSMAWWQKDGAKTSLDDRTVSQPQPPSNSFDPSPSIAGQNQQFNNGYPGGNSMGAGSMGTGSMGAGGVRTADGSAFGPSTSRSGVQHSSYNGNPYTPTGAPGGSMAPTRTPYGQGAPGGMGMSSNPAAGGMTGAAPGGSSMSGGGMYGAASRGAQSPGNSYSPSTPSSGFNPSSSGSQNWPQSNGGSTMPKSSTTVPNPYAPAYPPSAGGTTSGQGSFGGGAGARTTSPATQSGSPNGASINYPSTGAPPISSSGAGRSLPPSLSQYQGTYAPGSVGAGPSGVRSAANPAGSMSATTPSTSTPPTPAVTGGATPSSGGSFSPGGGGSFPGASPTTSVYR